jgi:hypothetical protein
MKCGITIALIATLFSLPVTATSYDQRPIKVFNNFNETIEMHLMIGKNPFEGLIEGNIISSGKFIDLYVIDGVKSTQNFIEFKKKDNGIGKWIFTFSRQNQYSYAKDRTIGNGLAVSYDINVNTNTLHAIYLCSKEYAHTHQGLCT